VAVLLAVTVYHLLTEELDFAENLPLQYLLAGVVVVSLGAFVRQTTRAQSVY
jgi:branched-subunit amino acid transport protein